MPFVIALKLNRCGLNWGSKLQIKPFGEVICSIALHQMED